MSRGLKKLPHGKLLQQMLNVTTLFAQKYPSKVPEFSRDFFDLVAKYNSDIHNFRILPVKGEYVVVIGNLYAKKEILQEIAGNFGIINLRFFENDKLSNLAESVSSERCIGVIIGGAPHSLPENVENNYPEKFFPAVVGEKRKITRESFNEAINSLMTERSREHLIIKKAHKAQTL